MLQLNDILSWFISHADSWLEQSVNTKGWTCDHELD